MSKFHINKNGVPAVCRAKEGNCPYGGDSGSDNHFDTKEDAQRAIDKTNEHKHGLVKWETGGDGSSVNEEETHNEASQRTQVHGYNEVLNDEKQVSSKVSYFESEDFDEDLARYDEIRHKKVYASKREVFLNGRDIEDIYTVESLDGSGRREVFGGGGDDTILRNRGLIATDEEIREANELKERMDEYEKYVEENGIVNSKLAPKVRGYMRVVDRTMDEYKIQDLTGDERWVVEDDYKDLESRGLFAKEGESVYLEREDSMDVKVSPEKRRIVNMKREADVDTIGDVYYNYKYKSMDTEGNVEWISSGEYQKLKEEGNTAEGDEVFAFPAEAKPEPTKQSNRKGFMGRLRNIFR